MNELLQSLYDRVSAHLLAQNKKAEEKNVTGCMSCRYRTADGLKCAVGCLISDSEYSEELEGAGIYSDDDVVRAVENSLGRRLTHDAVLLLGGLQAVHDIHPPEEWPHRLKKVYSDFRPVSAL